jgi:hypothetical protein
MHSRRVADLLVGDRLGPLRFVVSRAANERYWHAAGVEHPARAAGLLYPPLAANLTILLLQTVVGEAVLHTSQRLESHCAAESDTTLAVTGAVTERYERRGREYAVVEATVARADEGRGDELLWTSTATFTPVAS